MGRRRRSSTPAGRGPVAGPVASTGPAEPPPRERLRKGKTITIGQVESLADGRELRCFVDGGRVVVAVFEGERRKEPALSAPRGRLGPGDALDEGELSRVLDSYRVFSPWHDGEYTCLVLTVDCLRSGREHELLVFKDL